MTLLWRDLAAGFVATVPMTLTMAALHRRLPPEERYPLPPTQVTRAVADAAGVPNAVPRRDEQRIQVVLAAHFAYGAAAGAIVAPLARRLELPRVAEGVLLGSALWAGSYLGWLPAAGLMAPATQHPMRRNALMLAAHWVWGAATVLLADDGRHARDRCA